MFQDGKCSVNPFMHRDAGILLNMKTIFIFKITLQLNDTTLRIRNIHVNLSIVCLASLI